MSDKLLDKYLSSQSDLDDVDYKELYIKERHKNDELLIDVIEIKKDLVSGGLSKKTLESMMLSFSGEYVRPNPLVNEDVLKEFTAIADKMGLQKKQAFTLALQLFNWRFSEFV